MAQITPGDAVTLVRRNLDELELNGSIMYDTDTDNESLDNIIKRHLPDAINTVHLAAPVQLLEGEDSRSFIDNSEASKLADGQYLYEFSLELRVIWRQVFNESATNYHISPLLRDNIINCLTAKVLESFGDQRAQSYYQKAYSF